MLLNEKRQQEGQEVLARRGGQEFFKMTGNGSQKGGESSKCKRKMEEDKKRKEREGSSDNAVKGSKFGEEGGQELAPNLCKKNLHKPEGWTFQKCLDSSTRSDKCGSICYTSHEFGLQFLQCCHVPLGEIKRSW